MPGKSSNFDKQMIIFEVEHIEVEQLGRDTNEARSNQGRGTHLPTRRASPIPKEYNPSLQQRQGKMHFNSVGHAPAPAAQSLFVGRPTLLLPQRPHCRAR